MIKRLILTIVIALIFLISLALMVSGPIAAQEPTPLPTKGTGPLAAPTETPPPIDRSLLPKIEPQLLKKLLTEDEPVPFIVYMKETADLESAVAAVPAIGAQGEPDPLVKRTTIVNTLQQTAQKSQTGVLQQLSNPSGGLSTQAAADIQSLWIINAVAAKGKLQMVLDLAARPDVSVVRLDKTVQLSFPPPTRLFHSSPYIPHSAPEWGIAKIRANLVHNALGFDGSGVVVANIDSGVDWYHPDLQSKYRGYMGPGKLPQHIGNWHDATGMGAAYPTDGDGHGTHTMGTMVGANGIGVAPGAQWIAVRAFNNNVAQNSWLHEAFQWILAPDNNPALAPDIVNNSWGSSNGYSTEFQSDIQSLLAAGIYPVFSAGNDGPYGGTVGSPASLNIAFAVGATTIDDEIANFSSRGPSPWGTIKPEVSAPGKDVLSTLPGGTYGEYDGTSMAAPHAAGLAALILEASPGLGSNLNGISEAMKSTAVQLGSPIPNNDFGWGRIDAYNAVMSVASVGVLQGTVTGSGSPLANATIHMAPRSSDPAINTTTNSNGFYRQGLAANIYDVTASAFGYDPVTVYNVNISNNTTTVQDFELTPKATGTLFGTVKENGTDIPLAATINIENTPASINTNPADGSFSLILPTGTYTATVIASGHRITKAINIIINDGAPVERNFLLDSAPTILLVDSGRWYQESEIEYYQQVLDDLLYTYDAWEITKPFETPNDVPSAATLNPYDIVIWSSPLDSPGYVGANDALEAYLDNGGKLLLSGQDVAYYDSGNGIFVSSAPYLEHYLKTKFVADFADTNSITGSNGGPLTGLSFTINEGDGADNQFAPDVIANSDPDFAGSLLAYGAEDLAGLHIGLCVPYRALFFSFGIEGISDFADRRQVMEQAIDWLTETPAAHGVELTPSTETYIGNFGTTVSHNIRLRNTGTNNDTYTLSIGSGTPQNWPVLPNSLPPISLSSCHSQTITLDAQITSANTWHISDTFTVTATSTQNPALTDTATRTTKTPAPVLLVDDDRWYSFAEAYKFALEANNIPYDYWYVPKSWSGETPPSPPLDTLQMYPMVVWYTAYDWFQPLTEEEETRLAAYLDDGGRLFFSSQDYIYNLPDNKPSDFTKNYLGVLEHTEDFSSTIVSGWPGNPVGHRLGPFPLNFPAGYNNWTDALTPTALAQPATTGQHRQINSVTLAGVGPGGDHWHTNFLAYGPELLSDAHRTRLMERSLGWLSWLGRSTVTSNISSALNGATVVYTATIINDGWIDLPAAYFTATFPSALTIESSRSPELQLSNGELIWNGPLNKDQGRVFTYTATITDTLPLGTVVTQTNWLAYPEHNIRFDRVADVYVNFPNLNTSSMNVVPTHDVEANDTLTYTIVLKNTGLVDAPMVTTTNTLPHMLALIETDTPSRGTLESSGNSLTWTTPLSVDEVVTLSYRVSISYRTESSIRNIAYADDNLNEPMPLTAQTMFHTTPYYLPIIYKD